MKINFVAQTYHPILFREIGVGTCFALEAERYYRQGIQNANVYMKIPACFPTDTNDGTCDTTALVNCVNLANGTTRFSEEDDEIILIPATLNAEVL